MITLVLGPDKLILAVVYPPAPPPPAPLFAPPAAFAPPPAPPPPMATYSTVSLNDPGVTKFPVLVKV